MSKEEEYTSDSGSDFTEFWIDWFLGTKGNEYFVDIDVEYITDKFNLTGLYQEVEKIPQVIDVITDGLKIEELTDEEREILEFNARLLYGLIHSRYIITARGLTKMLEKYKNADFGYCSRVFCQLQHLLPVGLSDTTGVSAVKLYCPKCEDLYNPKSSRHSLIDGAFFGTSFPGMFLQAFPHLVPQHSTERYVPKIFGFNLHDYSKIARWQELQRIKLETSLINKGINTRNVPNGFKINNEENEIDDEIDGN
ncbi:Casein kinase II subunit beta [Wickerhamomyces ciferrii]|uniref:Casein kinase II subunit beta n=1 Tax=Wickerhamomyces ciferrii (strain ATCC 14091 / BCRC 22168 / CBS 111 / JCM 3599 / NBRC 0793 / NRRL Y-1031 F-60-10) TaxID=1206466 RepID=K0KFC4_WICCF|nr:Casein kinase II subunit beta [Wickerhamomyces ciferrii]CCH43815.1 Casein kinase II subunit beta [Wickerhamomyces ciferrii]